jgi:hypothetical protein
MREEKACCEKEPVSEIRYLQSQEAGGKEVIWAMSLLVRSERT